MPDQTITIDGKEYDAAKLSESAKAQVTNLRVTDAEISRMKAQLAIFETARRAYALALQRELTSTDAPN